MYTRVRVRWLLAVLAVVPFMVAAAASPALAQAEPHRWSGVYFGGSVDFLAVNGDTRFDPKPDPQTFASLMPTTIEMRESGIAPRIFGGANWRAAGLLVGVEGDYSFGRPDVSGESSPIIRNDGSTFPGGGSLTADVDQRWLVTGRVRGGFTVARTLIYGTAGLAVGGVDYHAFADYPARDYLSEVSATKIGWTAGAGVEFAVAPFLHARFEFRVVDLGDESDEVGAIPADPPRSIKFTWQTKGTDFSGGLLVRF